MKTEHIATTKTSYTFRPELTVDAIQFLMVAHAEGFVTPEDIQYFTHPEEKFQIESFATLEQLREITRHFPDAHVIRSTIQPTAQYTGERDWDLE